MAEKLEKLFRITTNSATRTVGLVEEATGIYQARFRLDGEGADLRVLLVSAPPPRCAPEAATAMAERATAELQSRTTCG